MPDLQQPIGILGGTFDPIHFGHLRMALELQQDLRLAHIRLIPCYQPVHQKTPIASAEDRLNMVKEAISETSVLCLDRCEIDRQGPSYTIDTLRDLRQRFPQTPLCLIMGIDALLSFSTWHRWEDILTCAHLVVAHRPHYDLPKTGQVIELLNQRHTEDPNVLQQSLAGKILLHPITLLEISSTDIRTQLQQGLNIRYLLPDNVYNYINKHGTYAKNAL